MAIEHCAECGEERRGRFRRERCEKCYRRLIRNLKAAGQYARIESPELVEQVIFDHTTPAHGGCVVFTGHIDCDGYGRLSRAGKNLRVHRAIYEKLIGPIPPDHQIDHVCHTQDSQCLGGRKCRHRRCVNPAHLEAVVGEENNRRGQSPSAINARKTHCIHRHEFTPENTRWKTSGGGLRLERVCRTCDRTRRRDYKRRKRSAT